MTPHMVMQDAIVALYERHSTSWFVLGGRAVMLLARDLDEEPAAATQAIADLINDGYLDDQERCVDVQGQQLPRICLMLTQKALAVVDRRSCPAP